MALKIVVLCGGNGTRLWPISRESYPKQFNTLLGEYSLFQQTLLRNLPLFSQSANFEIVSNEQFYFLIKDQARSIDVPLQSIILESTPKNTAPAIAFSALNSNPEDILLVLPSDHYIPDSPLYAKAIEEAIDFAKNGYITTFGITPTSPHTGYGYIKVKDKNIESFIEKPDLATAKTYFESQEYYWNSGMFCFCVKDFLRELEIHSKEVLQGAKKALNSATKEEILEKDQSTSLLRLPKDSNLPSVSIDYALMEKCKKLACVKASFDWSDIGSFDSLSDEYDKLDSKITPPSHILQQESKNNFILSNRFVATLGVEDLLIIDTPDSLLIAKKGRSQDIKGLIPKINETHPHLTKFHSLTHRPWGYYQILLEGPTYKIKKILVKPNSRLSLQRHHHRNEHWIVVSGSATVTLEKESFELRPNESTYIPANQTHRLANLGKIDLIIIEIQMGEYLGEDDIVRLEDDFKRC